jgi:hypothetical protein
MMQMMGWIASGLVFVTFYLRDDLKMRAVGALANLAFITFALLGLQDGIFDTVLPIMILHVSTFFVNVSRLYEAIQERGLLRSVGIAKVNDVGYSAALISTVVVGVRSPVTALAPRPPLMHHQSARALGAMK